MRKKVRRKLQPKQFLKLFRASKRVSAKKSSTKRNKQPAKKRKKPARKEYEICSTRGRDRFYKKLREDFRDTQVELIGEDEIEAASALRVVIDIGYDIKGKTRRKKTVKRSIGHRVFKDLRKLRNFLGLTYRYSESDYPDWSKRGACLYNKRASIIHYRMRGRRVIGEITHKKYNIKKQ